MKQLKMLLAQGFCFLIASLMHHATNCTDLERFGRDYRKGFLAELLSSLSLCIGLGDCTNSHVNYSLRPQYFNFTSIDFSIQLILGGVRKVIQPLFPRAVKGKETLSVPQECAGGDVQ